MVTGGPCAVTSPPVVDACGGGGRQSSDQDARLDIAFIDADSEGSGVEVEVTVANDAATSIGSDECTQNTESDAVSVERTDVNGSAVDGRTASPCGAVSSEMAPSPAARAGGLSPQPLKSALKSGSTRRRLQVVINESRNTYCEAAACEEPEEEVPRLVSVRAFSLSLPELLSFEPAVQLSPPAAYRDMVEAGELCQETAVDDSEGSESSGDGLEVPSVPLARLDDLTLTPSEDSPPEGSDTQPEDISSAETDEKPSAEVELAPSIDSVAPSTVSDAGSLSSSVSSQTKLGDEALSSPSSASSSSSSADSLGPLQSTSALPGGAWRNLPDLVTDGAPAQAPETSPPPVGSESVSPSPPSSPSSPQTSSASPPASSSVLTLANVQQHDKVIAIADSRTEGLLQGILKGGRLWGGGGRSVSDSDDSELSQQQRRSVRFTRQEECSRAPVVVQLGPPPAVPLESDGESSISSMDTVIAVALGAESGRATPAASTAQSDGTRSGDEAGRPLPMAVLAQAVVGGRSSAEVARAIHHNTLRRSLARGDPAAAPAAAAALPLAVRRQMAAGELSGSCPNLSLTSPERAASAGTGASLPARVPFSPPPPDIQVPGDVREWKLSERLWPSESPTPARRQPLERLDTLLAEGGSPPLLASTRPQPEPRRRSLDVPEQRTSPPADPQSNLAPGDDNALSAAPAPPRQLVSPVKVVPAPRMGQELAKRLIRETPAGDRDSAASSAESRDSYSLDDIDEALVTEHGTDSELVLSPPLSPPPTGVKEGSADSGYGSNDGRAPDTEPSGDSAETESDELAAFADLQADRTERLRRRYNNGGSGRMAEVGRQSYVRGIRPRFGATSEILRQMQQQVAPRRARVSDWRLPPVEEVVTTASTPARQQQQPPQGYVFPQYQPPRGPPLPPRHGQVRPTGATPPVSSTTVQQPVRRAFHQSAPNLYNPAQERRIPPPPPPAAPPRMQPLSRTVSATLPLRGQEDYAMYGHTTPQWHQGYKPAAMEQRQMVPEQSLHRGAHQRSLSGPFKMAEYPYHHLQHQHAQQLQQQRLPHVQQQRVPPLQHQQQTVPQYPAHQQQPYQHQLQQHQQHELLRRQQSAGAEQRWRRPGQPAHLRVPTRPFSSADMYPRLREPPAGHYTPQPYIHDI